MTDWLVISAVLWMLLVAAVIFLALCRISAAMQDEKLMRAGLSASSPVHLHLRHMIQSEDKTGIALTIAAFLCSLVLAFLLANWIFEDAVHKIIQALSFQ